MILVGCGQVSQETGGGVEEPTSQVEIKETVVASTKLTISLTGNEGSGYQTSAIQTSRIATQSVEIEANVQGFMTFDVNSTISFDVDQLAWIEANGYIQINVTYNKLMEDTLQNCRVRAYMVGADGLVGQINASNIIPLEVEVTAPPMHTPYSPLTTTTKNIKQWDKPFNEAINEVILLKLKGDFRRALNQQFKGTIMLEFVRDDEVVEDDNTVLLLHMDGEGQNFVDSSAKNHSVSVVGDTIQLTTNMFNKSAYFDGNDYLEISDSDDWDFGNGDFTIDFWIYFDNDSLQDVHEGLVAQYEDYDNRFLIWFTNNNEYGICFGYRDEGIWTVDLKSNDYSDWQPRTWYHVAVTKHSNVYTIFRNGVVINSVVSDYEIENINGSLLVGGWGETSSLLNGNIDELRISKGIARWTSDFTPPTAPY
jgi:hypothetical protein